MEDRVLSTSPKAANDTAAASGTQPRPSSEELLAIILKFMDEEKAEEIVSIDLRGKTSMADSMVVCSGRSSRQVAALTDKLQVQLKQDYGILSKVEGKDQGDWVLLDTGDVIVHVFRPEVREFYQLEKMWMNPGETPPAPGA